MGAKTGIEWTDATWSPLKVRVRANAADIARAKNYTSLIQIGEKMAGHIGQHCEHISDGCLKCYSGTWQGRCLKSGGTGLPFDRRSRDLVEPFVDERTLGDPLRWKTAKKIFVENQSDLFGEWYTDEMIDRVFAVMAQCGHIFQILTKRPERMLTYINGILALNPKQRSMRFARSQYRGHPAERLVLANLKESDCGDLMWPLPNVWLGVSVENFPTWDARVHLLKETLAAKRFVSYEPALANLGCVDMEGIDWLIVGGESGPGARPFDVQCVLDTVAQCHESGTACFVKQLGAKPFNGYSLHKQIHHRSTDGRLYLKFKDRKGGDMEEWPDSIPRVRQFPGEQPIIPASQNRADEFHDPEPEC